MEHATLHHADHIGSQRTVAHRQGRIPAARMDGGGPANRDAHRLRHVAGRLVTALCMSLLLLGTIACGGDDGATDGAPASDAGAVEQTEQDLDAVNAPQPDQDEAGAEPQEDAEGGEDTGSSGGPPDEDLAGDEGAADGSTAAGDGMGTETETRVPAPPAAPPTPAGSSRLVEINEVPGLVPFTVYLPSDLPDETYLDVVRLTEAMPDQTVPGLPSVNLIYTVDLQGGFRILQSPAGDRPLLEGDEATDIEIAGMPARLVRQGSTHAVTWEQDGTRIEVISADLTPEELQELAAALEPVSE